MMERKLLLIFALGLLSLATQAEEMMGEPLDAAAAAADEDEAGNENEVGARFVRAADRRSHAPLLHSLPGKRESTRVRYVFFRATVRSNSWTLKKIVHFDEL